MEGARDGGEGTHAVRPASGCLCTIPDPSTMRLAFFSPLSPKPSGIADYSEALLPHLAARVDSVDVFIEDYEPSPASSREGLRIRDYREFEADYYAGCYDAVLYHMGNNPFHVYIYDLAIRIPGVIVLHEFNLHHLLAAVTITRNGWDSYLAELEYNAGAAALERARQAQASLIQLDYDNIAMNRRLLERSRGVIVHSDYVGNLVKQAGFQLPICKIPHGVEAGAAGKAEARRQLAELASLPLEDSTPVFGVFGFLKPYKRIYEALRAFARVRALHPAIKIILVGEEHPHYPLRSLIEELGIGDAVRILGYVPLDTFVTCMAACDICINLRRPTVGETSGSLLRALALGKPTLVSEIGAFMELPDDVAVKIPVDDKEVDWLFEYMNILLNDPALAQAIGERAREYAARECAWPKVAAEYAQFLKQCVARERAPANLESLPQETTSSAAASISIAAPSTGPAFSPQEMEEYIVGFSHGSPLMEDYVQTHIKRLAHTVGITPPGGDRDRILELGCYLHMTPALRKYLCYGEVRGAYYGSVGKIDYRATTSSSGEVFACPVDLFDAEKDRFPYPDGYFNTVLCCELIEHLATDPMHMISEINRILAPGGALVLTTPNIASLRGLHAVLLGYHPGLFHAYIKPAEDGTIDPRHSREYTPREISMLFDVAGFQVELLETGEYWSRDWYADSMEKLLEANQFPTDLRGLIIYCRGRKVGPIRERWPKELYYP